MSRKDNPDTIIISDDHAWKEFISSLDWLAGILVLLVGIQLLVTVLMVIGAFLALTP